MTPTLKFTKKDNWYDVYSDGDGDGHWTIRGSITWEGTAWSYNGTDDSVYNLESLTEIAAFIKTLPNGPKKERFEVGFYGVPDQIKDYKTNFVVSQKPTELAAFLNSLVQDKPTEVWITMTPGRGGSGYHDRCPGILHVFASENDARGYDYGDGVDIFRHKLYYNQENAKKDNGLK